MSPHRAPPRPTAPHRAVSALATALALVVLSAVVPVARATSRVTPPKNVTISIAAEYNMKAVGTYLKGANASQFSLWSSDKVSASLRRAICCLGELLMHHKMESAATFPMAG